MDKVRNRYKFEMQCGERTHTANPIYKDLKKEWKQESGQIFFRQSLSGQLDFVGDDYEFILGCDFGDDIVLNIYHLGNKYIESYFRRTDCTVDIDHKIISVQPKVKDEYKAILDKYNEEYDLMKHNPKLSDVSMDVRPTLQVYTLGSDYVANYIGSTMYKKPVSPIYDMENYGYLNFVDTVGVTAMVTFTLYEEQFLGRCMASVSTWNTEENETYDYLYMYDVEDVTRPYRLRLERGKETMLVYIYFEIYTQAEGWQILYRREPMIEFVNLSSLDTLAMYPIGRSEALQYEMVLDFSYNQIFTRLLCKGSNDAEVIEQDIFNTSSIYNQAVPIRMQDNLIVSTATSSEITKYGLVKGQTEQYYVPTTDETNINKYIPLVENKWSGKFSFWLKLQEGLIDLEAIYTVQKTLKDWVSLYEAIRVLLKAVDDTVSFRKTSISSQFLFALNNPVSGEVNQGELFLLAKSNATKLEYEYSATKTPITIGKILDWLKTYNVYWDIYEFNNEKVLRIEHISYYMNGCSYGESGYNTIDLRQVYDTRNGKNFAFRTNNWKYDTNTEQPTTLFYKWMDEVSIPFEGEAMRAVKRLTDEHQETRSTDTFTSDIDYIFANSNDVSKDGFVVVQASKETSESTASKIKYYATTIDGRQYNLQNGLLSTAYLQKYYLPYDLAFDQAEITSGEIVDVKQKKRLRTHDITFFLPKDVEINEYTLLTTLVGNGKIGQLTQLMSNEEYTATLKYELDNAN